MTDATRPKQIQNLKPKYQNIEYLNPNGLKI